MIRLFNIVFISRLCLGVVEQFISRDIDAFKNVETFYIHNYVSRKMHLSRCTCLFYNMSCNATTNRYLETLIQWEEIHVDSWSTMEMCKIHKPMK